MAFDWTDLLGVGLPLGGAMVGNATGLNPSQGYSSKLGVEENKRQFDIKNQQAQQAREMLMPTLRTNLGYRGPQAGGGMLGAPGSTPTPMAAPQQGGGALGKVGGIASKIGMASQLPVVGGLMGGIPGLGMLGALGPAAPIGAAALAGITLAKKIGQGRKAANRLTGPSGAQGEFGQIMSEVAKREGAGQINEAQRSDLLARSLEAKIQQAMAAVKNKNDTKVIKQWLGDFSQPKWGAQASYLNPVAQKYLAQLG